MNVRLSEGEIRFRVSPDEFEQLGQGNHLQLDTIPMTFIVQPARGGIENGMALDLSCGQFHLAVSRDEIDALAKRIPSRQGIAKRLVLGMGKELNVSLEVDLKP